MKVSCKTSKKLLQKSLQQNNGVWDQLLLQNGPWESPRQVPEPPRQPPGRQPPGSLRGVQRRLQAAPVTPLWLPQAPLVSLWLPLSIA